MKKVISYTKEWNSWLKSTWTTILFLHSSRGILNILVTISFTRPPVFQSSQVEHSPGSCECWIGAFISARLGSPSWETDAAAPSSVSSTLVTVKCGIVTVRTLLSLYLFPSRLLSLPTTSLLCPFLTLITAHGRPRQGIGKYFQFTWPTALREGNLENTPSKVVFTTHLKGLGIPPLAYLLLNCENHKNGLGCFPREAKGRRVGRMLETVHCVHNLKFFAHQDLSLCSHVSQDKD